MRYTVLTYCFGGGERDLLFGKFLVVCGGGGFGGDVCGGGESGDCGESF